MPLIIPKTLPAYDALYEENVFVMHRERAASQHIRPLEILILNLMPTKIPCCGGGSGTSKKPKTKFLDGPVIGRKTLKISGMHCKHCANTVTNALNGLDGVTAKVSLKENSAEVSYDREIDLADLKNAVKNAGYEVTSIS